MTTIGRVYWTGASGQRYTFDMHPLGSPLPRSAGLYVFAGGDGWVPTYFGETEDFFDRLYAQLDSHHAIDCARRNGATHVGVLALTGGKTARLNAEADLRNAVKTACNRQ